MKERFSISLEAETREKIDELVKRKKEFANRSQAIEYCINFVLELETKDKRYISFLIDFFDVMGKHPEVGEKLQVFLRDEGTRIWEEREKEKQK